MIQSAPTEEVINFDLLADIHRVSDTAREDPRVIVALAKVVWGNITVEEQLELIQNTADTVGTGPKQQRKAHLVMGTVVYAIFNGYMHPNYWKTAEATASDADVLDWPPAALLRDGQPVAAHAQG